jgi:hypothetical protein
MVPAAAEFEGMVRQYCGDLADRMAANRLGVEFVLKSEVRLAFDDTAGDVRSAVGLPGFPFRCTAELMDDPAQSYVSSHVGVAKPHDVDGETKSRRATKPDNV